MNTFSVNTLVFSITVLSQYSLVVSSDCQDRELCQWNSWHEWSACNATCGTGVQSRWRGPCCDPNAGGFMECIDLCKLDRSAYREYKGCTGCPHPPSTTTSTTRTTTEPTTITTKPTTTKTKPTTTTTTTKPTTRAPKKTTKTLTTTISTLETSASTKRTSTTVRSSSTTPTTTLRTTSKQLLTSSNTEVQQVSTTVGVSHLDKLSSGGDDADTVQRSGLSGGVIAGIALGSTCVVTTALVLVLKHCKLLKRTKVTSLKPETH